jgi:hypothetical protein
MVPRRVSARSGLRWRPAEEIEDLDEQAARMRARLYEARDRKYQSARAMAARDLKADYVAKVSRRRNSGK